jgi:hypothetical protein
VKWGDRRPEREHHVPEPSAALIRSQRRQAEAHRAALLPHNAYLVEVLRQIMVDRITVDRAMRGDFRGDLL